MTTIVTLGLDAGAAAWFNEQRQRFYPAALNRIPAHVSLFHALPGDGSVRYALEQAASTTSVFPLQVTGLRSMGRGVLYTLESPDLLHLHESLVRHFRTYLTPQDKQPLRPHVVVQNKVEPGEAKALLASLQAQFTPFAVEGTGLDWWEYLGGPWRLLEHFSFAGRSHLAGPDVPPSGARPTAPEALRVERVRSLSDQAQRVLEEYYEAAAVVQRDDRSAMEALLQDPDSAMWLAYLGNEVAGCVVLRAGVPEPGAGECKRLFVRPAFRRAGVAAALMDTLEDFARGHGIGWIYLDTHESFAASVALYQRRGYVGCPRYNANPQATLFFRKPLQPATAQTT